MTLQELLVKIGVDMSGMQAGLDQATTAFSGAASKMAALGETIASSLALPLAGIGVAAFKAAEDFEAATRRIRNLTGETGESLKDLTEVFEHLYTKSAASSESIATALATLSSRTNLTGESLEKLTMQLLKVSKAMGVDVAAAVPAVTRMFGDWSISTDKMAGALTYLQSVSQKTGVNMLSIAEQAVYAGAPLRALGYNFEQATAIIGKFEKEGVNVELVLGGMKAALGKFAKEGVKDVAEQWKGFLEGIKQGVITFKQVSDEVDVKRATDLFRAVKEGRFEIDALVESSKNAAAALEKVGGPMQSLSTKATLMKRELSAALVPLGEILLGIANNMLTAMKPAVDWIAHLLAGFKSLSPGSQEAVVAIGGIIVAIGGLRAAMKLLDVFDEATGLHLAKPFERMAEAAKHAAESVAASASGMVSSMKNVKFAVDNDMTGALSRGEAQMLAFVRAIPTAIAFTAIGAGVAIQLNELRKALQGFAEEAKYSWKGVSAAVQESVDLWKPYVTQSLDGVKGIISFAVEVAKRDFGTIGEAFATSMTGVSKILDFTLEVAKRDFGGIWEFGVSAADKITEAFSRITLKDIGIQLLGAGNALTDLVKTSTQLQAWIREYAGIYPEMARALGMMSAVNNPEVKANTSTSALMQQLALSKQQMENLAAAQAAFAKAGVKHTPGASAEDIKAMEEAAKKAAAEIQAAFGTLGLTDYEKKLEDLQAAYDLLGEKGKLSAYGIAKAMDAIRQATEDAKKSLVDFDFEKLGVQSVEKLIGNLERTKAAFADLQAQFLKGAKGVGLDDILVVSEKLKKAQEELAAATAKVFQAQAQAGKAASDSIKDEQLSAIQLEYTLRAGAVAIHDVQVNMTNLATDWKQVNQTAKETIDILKSWGQTSQIALQANAQNAQNAFNLLKVNGAPSGDVEKMRRVLEDAKQAADPLIQAFKDLGVTSQTVLDEMARRAKFDFDKIKEAFEQGKVSTADFSKAYVAMIDATAASSGKLLSAGELGRYLAALDQMKTPMQQQIELARQFKSEMDRAFDGMETAMANSIVEWGHWKDNLINVGKQFAQGFLKTMLSNLFQPLQKQASSMFGSLAASVFGGFKLGASSATSTMSSFGGAPISTGVGDLTKYATFPGGAPAGLPAGGVASAAPSAPAAPGTASSLSSFASTANLITGAISAISSVIGNFQSAKMETTMNAIEKSTRYTQIITQHISDMFDKFLPKIQDTYDLLAGAILITIRQVRDAIMNSVSVNLSLRSGTSSGDTLIKNIVDRLNTPNTTMGDVMVDLITVTTKVFNAITDQTEKLNHSIVDGTNLIVGGLAAIEKKLPGLLEKILGFGGGLASGLGSAATAIPNAFGGIFSSLFGSLLGGGSSKDVGRIEVTTREIKAELMNLRKDEWDREGHLMAKLDDVWKSIREGFSALFTRLGDVWTSIREVASFGPMLESALNAFTAQMQAITVAASNNFDLALTDAIAQGFEMVTAGLDTVSAAIDNAANILGDIQGAVGIAASGIIEALTGIKDAVSTKPATAPETPAVPPLVLPDETTTTPAAQNNLDTSAFPEAINFVTKDAGQGGYFAAVVESIKELGALIVGQFDRLISLFPNLGTTAMAPGKPINAAALKQIQDATAVLNDLVAKGGTPDEVRAMAEKLNVSFKYLEDGTVQILDAATQLNDASDQINQATQQMQDSASNVASTFAGFSDVALPAISAAAEAVQPILAGFRDLGEVLNKAIVQPVSDSGVMQFAGIGPADAPTADDILRNYEGMFGPVNAGFMREMRSGSSPVSIGNINIVPSVDGKQVTDAVIRHLRDHGVEVY